MGRFVEVDSLGEVGRHGDVTILVVDPNRSSIGYCCKSAAVSLVQASNFEFHPTLEQGSSGEETELQVRSLRLTCPMYKLSTILSFSPRYRGMSLMNVPDASQALVQP